MNNNILETKQRLISAYEVVLRPNSSVQERKEAESVKVDFFRSFLTNFFSIVKG